jgi:hypothetical protein
MTDKFLCLNFFLVVIGTIIKVENTRAYIHKNSKKTTHIMVKQIHSPLRSESKTCYIYIKKIF